MTYSDKNDDVKYAIQLSFNSANLEADNKEQIENIIKVLQPTKPLKENWQWRTAFKCSTITVKSDEILPEDMEDGNTIFVALDKMLDKIKKKEKELKEAFEITG